MNTGKITTPEAYIDGVLSGDLALLARAITLVESRHLRHRETADAVLNALLPYSGKATRVGITGAGNGACVDYIDIGLGIKGHDFITASVKAIFEGFDFVVIQFATDVLQSDAGAVRCGLNGHR